MGKVMNISDYQLNLYVSGACPRLTGAKKWKKIDIGGQETYVGDGLYVITLIKHRPANIDEMKVNCNKLQPVVIRYLQGEGFITDEYLYIGLQEIDLQNLPEGI